MKILLILFVISFNAYAFNISSGISGSWYDKTNPGQGFNIEVLDGNHIVIYWYSHDRGKPIWLAGSGTYQGNVATLELFYVQGSDFGVHHSNNLLFRKPFGSTIFTFDNCNSGSMTYNSSINFGTGSLRLDRLTTLSGLQCVDTEVPASTEVPEPFSSRAVELAGIRWELSVCELLGTILICDFKVTSLDEDVGIELLSSEGGTIINVDGNILRIQEVKLGNNISRSIFFGPKASLKKNIVLNGHVIFKEPPSSTGKVDFLNLSFKLDQEVFDIEYFDIAVIDKRR